MQVLKVGDILPDAQVLTDEGGESVTLLVCAAAAFTHASATIYDCLVSCEVLSTRVDLWVALSRVPAMNTAGPYLT
jgi:3-dehydroquinate dehydratase